MKERIGDFLWTLLLTVVGGYVFFGIYPILATLFAQNWWGVALAVVAYIVNLLILRWIRKQDW